MPRSGQLLGVLLLGLLASCAPVSREAPVADPPRSAEKETLLALEALERSFYVHWGTVEARSEFRDLGATHVPVLRGLADANGEHALMALRVLKRLAPEEPFTDEARAILYASALSRERNFLRWGSITGAGFLPGVYGQELMLLGDVATAPLRRRLDNRRRAWVIGRRVGRENRDQQDRVCDYAWVMLCEIHDRPLVYHRDPRSRDEEIRRLDLWLERRGD